MLGLSMSEEFCIKYCKFKKYGKVLINGNNTIGRILQKEDL